MNFNRNAKNNNNTKEKLKEIDFQIDSIINNSDVF